MGLYERPPYYALTHILFGISAVWYPIVGILVLIYQLGQYFFNRRVFLFEWTIKKGNSIEHTLLKLAEVGFGYCIGSLIYRDVLNLSTSKGAT